MKKTKKLKLVTHDGSFHADDIFACATLSLLLEKDNKPFTIIRTRDEEIIAGADYVFDVGGVYDEKLNRFDHHQPGGAGKRDNNIEYSSFGLIWKKFGEELSGSGKASEIIDKKLVAPVDAHDNGFDLVTNIYEVSTYSIQHFFYSMSPTWREENVTDDEMFLKCVQMAKDILSREIVQARDLVLAEEVVILTYKETEDKRVIILDKHYPYESILQDYPEPLFVVCPSRMIKNKWSVKALREDLKIFKNRKDFPKSWGGLKSDELQKITGVSDAVFCHKNLFLAVAKSKEGAIKLAKLAILG
ncbi:MAG: MYG1 family protein [Candidatus Nomurabacteria bacterium]|nr:MYG1 family protein [Candidatus Nomurabacteria bacterium]